MTICASAVQQPDGTYLLVLDPVNTNYSACAYVVESGSDLALSALANMTLDDANVIASGIALLWAIAFAFRQLAHFFNSEKESES